MPSSINAVPRGAMSEAQTLPFSRVLIANRGEIAVRIARTCHEMGLTVIAVYSEADAHALHVQMADEAYLIGPASATLSYLNIEAVMEAARSSGAQAVHPGYGFLAENPVFAQAVRDAGLIWVGPPPAVIALLGDKVPAKELARTVDVPIVPGYDGAEQDSTLMLAEAERIGYPLMLKAAAGGGGKGMRAVTSAGAFLAALEGAQREAQAAFGDSRVFLEKLVQNPRHVEIQVLVDQHGAAVSLGERDCSLQRRHQKVVEEAPSPAISPELRAAMSEDALRLLRAGGYQNAGTVEFLLSGDRYYFLEVNTRIQVEHAVTEMVTGVDLVRLQLEIAAGLPLSISQADVALQGHAIEVRLYAEDPEHDFLPSTGRITGLVLPEGPGVRNDVGVEAGTEVTQYYDPMLAKLIVHGDDRSTAVRCLSSALAQYEVAGPRTNLQFLRWVAARPEFVDGHITIDFLSANWRPEAVDVLPKYVVALAALAAVTGLLDPTTFGATSPWAATTGWRLSGFPRVFRFTHAGGEDTVELSKIGQGDGSIHVSSTGRGGRRSPAASPSSDWRAQVAPTTTDLMATSAPVGVPPVDRHATISNYSGECLTYSVLNVASGSIVASQADRVLRAEVSGRASAFELRHEGRKYRLALASDDDRVFAAGAGAGDAGPTAPMPGTVVKVLVAAGQHVSAHEPLIVLEAMKMEHVVEAPHEGVVRSVLVEPGGMVAAGALVVELDST